MQLSMDKRVGEEGGEGLCGKAMRTMYGDIDGDDGNTSWCAARNWTSL